MNKLRLKKIFRKFNNPAIFFNGTFLVIIASYLILGIILIPYYRFQLNPDGVSYISIAQKYLLGDLIHAINGYWSPLISWLLIPFLALKIDAILAFKIFNLIIGGFTIAGIKLLSQNFHIRENIRNIILSMAVPLILTFAFILITPDLLLLCLLIYYLSIIFKANYSHKNYWGAFAGLLGGFAYLSKQFAFFFFLTHFILFNCFYFLTNKKQRKTIIISFILGITIFLMISTPWIIALSNKYHYFTTGSAGIKNYSFVGTKIRGEIQKTAKQIGSFPPPNTSAVSTFEDPTYFNSKSWSPFQSLNNFKIQLKIIYKNTLKIISIYGKYSFFLPLIALGYLILITRYRKKLITKRELIFPTATIILYSTGYALVYLEPRHIWISQILFLIMGGYLLSQVFQNKFFRATQKKIILLIFAFSFILLPVKDLTDRINAGKNIYQLFKKIERYNIQGKIASNNNWYKTTFLAYYLKAQNYGQTDNLSPNEIKNQLVKNDIDYYFCWGKLPENHSQILKNYSKVTTVMSEGAKLEIYHLK